MSKMRTQEFTIDTGLSIDDIKLALQPALKGCDVDALESGGILDVASGASVEFVATKAALLTGIAAVQVFIFDGARREVRLIALGNTTAGRVMGGAKHTASLSKSVALAQRLQQTLIAAEAR